MKAHNTGMPDVEPAKRMTPSPEENQCDVCVEPKMDIGDRADISKLVGSVRMRELTRRMRWIFLLHFPFPIWRL